MCEQFIIAFKILGVILIVVGIFTFQIYMSQNDFLPKIGSLNIGSVITSLLNAFVIAVLNYINIGSAITLNDYENHRTDTNYEDSLIVKIFVFQLINSFSALTYVSFIKIYIGLECSNNDCTYEAASTLSTVFLSSLISRALLQVVVRKIFQDKRERDETSDLLPGVSPSPIEQQYILQEYSELTGTLADFAGLVMQYGFTILFVGAFPLAPTLAFVSGYIQIRIDGWKLCQAHRRPMPKTAEDIGTWQSMISILSVIGVIYNFGILFFTSNYLRNLRWEVRWLVFLSCEHITLILKYIIAEVIDDIPEEVAMQTAR